LQCLAPGALRGEIPVFALLSNFKSQISNRLNSVHPLAPVIEFPILPPYASDIR